jgi:hypothetical protein
MRASMRGVRSNSVQEHLEAAIRHLNFFFGHDNISQRYLQTIFRPSVQLRFPSTRLATGNLWSLARPKIGQLFNRIQVLTGITFQRECTERVRVSFFARSQKHASKR